MCLAFCPHLSSFLLGLSVFIVTLDNVSVRRVCVVRGTAVCVNDRGLSYSSYCIKWMTVRFRAQWSYTNYWSWHIKAFCCLSTIQMEVVFFSLAVYCHFTPDFRICLLCKTRRRWARTPGLCPTLERSVCNLRQLLLQWLRLNLKNW